MPSVGGVKVARILAAVVGKPASEATLTRVTPGTRTSGQSTSGTNPTSDDYPCKGYVRSYSNSEVDGDRIRASDRIIGIYGDTLRDDAGDLLVPLEGDRVTIAEEGLAPETYAVIDVGRGTAGARYLLHGRK